MAERTEGEGAARLALALPRVGGAGETLAELARLVGGAWSARDERLRLPARRPAGSGPELELRLDGGAEARLCWEGADPVALLLDALVADGASSARTAGALAGGASPRALSVDEVGARLRGEVHGVDHVGLDLPAARVDRARWRALLDPLAERALVLPFDAAGEIAFVVPATPRERARGLEDPAAPRKPKLELVRNPALALPMLGLALDTTLPLEELARRFPDPEGFFRPGNEAYFRTVLLAHPWPGLLVSLDLNSRETSALELARLLVEGGRTWREARAAG